MSSLTHAIGVLNCFNQVDRELRLSEISRRLGISKSHTHRLLSVLAQEGFVRRDSGSAKYRLGLRLFELGRYAVGDLDRRPVLAAIEELVRVTQETVLLSVREGWEVVFLERVDSPRALRVSPDLNQRHWVGSATGQALMAWETETEIELVIRRGLQREAGMPSYTPEGYREALEETRRHGFAVNQSSRKAHFRAVATPVRNANGHAVAALTVVAPLTRLTPQRVPWVVAQAQRTASELARQINPPAGAERHR